jgi:hypothetical protein
MYGHEEIAIRKNLPRVGDVVRNKKHGTYWRVMEKREVWTATGDDPQTGNPRMIPAIYLSYWKITEGQPPGVGQMLGYMYTLLDNTFETHWEIKPKK